MHEIKSTSGSVQGIPAFIRPEYFVFGTVIKEYAYLRERTILICSVFHALIRFVKCMKNQ
jgi:hypothetical protein